MDSSTKPRLLLSSSPERATYYDDELQNGTNSKRLPYALGMMLTIGLVILLVVSAGGEVQTFAGLSLGVNSVKAVNPRAPSSAVSSRVVEPAPARSHLHLNQNNPISSHITQAPQGAPMGPITSTLTTDLQANSMTHKDSGAWVDISTQLSEDASPTPWLSSIYWVEATFGTILLLFAGLAVKFWPQSIPAHSSVSADYTRVACFAIAPLPENLENLSNADNHASQAEEKALFSQVEFCPEKGCHRHTPGSVLGAAVLIGGGMVGAGALALPAKTLVGGFAPEAGTIVLCWLFMVATGLLMSEACLGTMAKTGRDRVSMESMSELLLGPLGRNASCLLFLGYHNLLMVAYLAKLSCTLSGLSGIDPAMCTAVCALFFGTTTYFGTVNQVDMINRYLTAIAFIAFFFIIAMGIPDIDLQLLGNMNFAEVPSTMPVIACSLMYHSVIPTVCSMLEGDGNAVRQAILLGTTAPVGLFLVWELVAMGSVPYAPGVDPLETLMASGGMLLPLAILAFSLTAVSTSALGFTLGLSNFYSEAIEKRMPKHGKKCLPYVLALVPPTTFAAMYPNSFFGIMEIAGVYGACVMFGIIPAAMAWKVRYGDVFADDEESGSVIGKPASLIAGGKTLIGGLMGGSGLMIGSYLYEQTSWLM